MTTSPGARSVRNCASLTSTQIDTVNGSPGSTGLEKRAFHGLVVEINDFTLGFCGTRREEIYDYMDNLGYEALTKRRDGTRIPFMGNEFFVPR